MSMPGRGAVEAVTFDYWNTLCYEPDLGYLRGLRLGALARVLDEDGIEIDFDRLSTAYDEAWEEFNRAWVENRQFTGVDAAHKCLEGIADACPPGTDRHDRLLDEFCSASESCELSVVDGVAEVLRALKGRGVRIGIICDVGLTPSPTLRRRLDEHGLLEFFDHWSFSDEVGVYKPDRRIFEHALSGLGGVPPERAAHVGDRRRTDIAGAQAMGMRAVRITAVYDDDDPHEGPAGDFVVGSYHDFLPALGLA